MTENIILAHRQAQAILDLRLHRLTGLEIEKLLDEYGSILDDIAEREAILADPTKLTEVIREEFKAVRNQFGDDRRSEIIESHLSLSTEDLIPREDMVVTFSKTGYAKTHCWPRINRNAVVVEGRVRPT